MDNFISQNLWLNSLVFSYSMATDPVCGMAVDEKTTKYTSHYNGKNIYFCREACKNSFDSDPSKYGY
jgi:YHS domain-containing protein